MLRRLSANLVIGLFLPAIPLEEQALFGKKTWFLEDFLSLPLVGQVLISLPCLREPRLRD